MAALVLALALTGCQFPRDPDGTLDRVRGATMVVGWTVNEPWVAAGGGEPSGPEPDVVRPLAESLDARVEWVQMPEAEIQEALRR